MGYCREKFLDLDETLNAKLTAALSPDESRAFYEYLLPVLMEVTRVNASQPVQELPGAKTGRTKRAGDPAEPER